MNEFIAKINSETDLGIAICPAVDGFTWTYNCIESDEIFPDACTALFDWIKWACIELNNQALDAQAFDNWDELDD